ncbi:MAG: hypothetical protein JO354_07825 [Verrucomicrobia bacterium]|nr:hypothetical protein [Verrucomicrobiota bacterium]
MAANLLGISGNTAKIIMAKFIVKPTVNFLSTSTDSDLALSVSAIIKGMTNNPVYPNPLPSLVTIDTARAAFVSAITDASFGGVLQTATKNARRAELVSLVRQLASYVAVACGGDLVSLLSSNFPIHKPTRDPIGRPDRPPMPKLSHGDQSGKIKASTKPVRGVFIYNWTVGLASDLGTITQQAQSTGAKISFNGLTPGQIYLVAVNAVGAAGLSDFSEPAPLMSL